MSLWTQVVKQREECHCGTSSETEGRMSLWTQVVKQREECHCGHK